MGRIDSKHVRYHPLCPLARLTVPALRCSSVRFQTPWSLKGFIKEQIERREVPGTDGVKPQFDVKGRREDRALVLKALGYRVLADIVSVPQGSCADGCAGH